MPPGLLLPLAVCVPAAFLLGSVPFALLIGRARGVDVRAHGSGNVGATNLGRALGFRAFLLCFVFDAAKGFGPTLAFGLWTNAIGMRAFDLAPAHAGGWLGIAAAAVLGHSFSPWINFRGGKGVATGLGALLAVYPVLTVPALGALLVFLGVFWVWRYVSLASILAAASLPVWVWYFFRLAATTFATPPDPTLIADRPDPMPTRAAAYLVVSGLLAGLVVVRHRANISRLIRGEERRIGGGPTSE